MYLDKGQFFYTPEGLCSFKHFREGETITVLNEKGNWTKGTVRAFGRKPLHPIIFMADNDEEYEVRCSRDARWLLQPKGVFVKKYDKAKKAYVKERHRCNVVSFRLQVDDHPLSIETTIFSGDEVMFILKNKNMVVSRIIDENHPGDAWGINLKEGNFFVLAENLLFGSCQ